MNRSPQEQIEAFRRRFRQDVQHGGVRERDDYIRDFPGCDAELEAALSRYGEAMETAHRTFVLDALASETDAAGEATFSGRKGSTHAGLKESLRRGRYE